MRTLLICNLLLITILLIYICILGNRVQVLTYENTTLKLMVEDIVNYSDSTADTGEFDEFIASPKGERFFYNYRKLCNN